MPTHRSRRHVASLLVPATETRHARRARIEAERSLVTDQERARAAAAPQQRTDEHPALQDAPPAPRAGERRPAAGRTWRRLRVQAHRATSATLAAAYPFLAEAGLGGAGMLVGTDAYSRRSFVYDPWVLYQRGVLTNPNLAVAGEIGAGKSALLKSLVSRSLCFGRRAYVPGDPKGEWTPLTRAVGGTALELGAGMPTRINPLDAGTRPVALAEDEWRREIRASRLGLLTSLAETLMGRPLRPVEHTAVATALDTAGRDGDPVLPQVVHTMLDPGTTTELPPGVLSRDRLAEDGRDAAHALARLVFGDLAGLFDQASTAPFEPDAPMISIDVSRIGENNALIPLVMACTSAWMEAALRDPAGGHRWMVYDEVEADAQPGTGAADGNPVAALAGVGTGQRPSRAPAGRLQRRRRGRQRSPRPRLGTAGADLNPSGVPAASRPTRHHGRGDGTQHHRDQSAPHIAARPPPRSSVRCHRLAGRRHDHRAAGTGTCTRSQRPSNGRRLETGTMCSFGLCARPSGVAMTCARSRKRDCAPA